MLKILSKILKSINYNFSPQNLPIYNEIEGTYIAGLLKKKANTALPVLEGYHFKAITTLKVLTENMIIGEIPLENILAYYKDVNR